MPSDTRSVSRPNEEEASGSLPLAECGPAALGPADEEEAAEAEAAAAGGAAAAAAGGGGAAAAARLSAAAAAALVALSGANLG